MFILVIFLVIIVPQICKYKHDTMKPKTKLRAKSKTKPERITTIILPGDKILRFKPKRKKK